MFEWNVYLIIIAVVAGLFFASAVAALVWAVKQGQFRNLEQGARSIFDDDEPEGIQQDFFPGQRERQDALLSKEHKAEA